MGYLHGRAIVHKDLRSNNLFVDERQHVTITDYGLANITKVVRNPHTLVGLPLLCWNVQCNVFVVLVESWAFTVLRDGWVTWRRNSSADWCRIGMLTRFCRSQWRLTSMHLGLSHTRCWVVTSCTKMSAAKKLSGPLALDAKTVWLLSSLLNLSKQVSFRCL